MSIKHHWKMNGRFYEVSQKQRQILKKEYDRHKRLKDSENEVTILSFDALGERGDSGDLFIADLTVNIEDKIIDKLMIEKLHEVLDKLPSDEKIFIELLFLHNKTEREVAVKLGLSQYGVNKRKWKILKKIKKNLEN